MTMLRAVLLTALAASTIQAPAEIIASIFTPATGTPQRPSASVAYITAGSTPVFAAFGEVSLAGGASPTANTLYEIGSITKGLTGAPRKSDSRG